MGVQIQDNNDLIQSQRREFIELTDEYDKAHLRKLCDFDKVNQKTHKLEENLKFLTGRITDLERQRKIKTKPSMAVEEDFSIDVNDKALHKRTSGSGKWFGGLFGKNHGSCCC